MNGFQQAPNGVRLHVSVFGKRNSGKSSLINAICGQEKAIVSSVAGTTADPVYQSMELYPIGPITLIDTAGFDDVGGLGELRVQKTEQIRNKTDLAILVVSIDQQDFKLEQLWLEELQKRGVPFFIAVNKMDLEEELPAFVKKYPFCLVSAKKKEGIEELRRQIIKLAPVSFELTSITGYLVRPNDTVLLVAPQDIQAPKGRLILPQVQTIRDLLDQKAIVIMCTVETMKEALRGLSAPPHLIITDSQVFEEVAKLCPAQTKLTSFSILFARYKGDVKEFIQGAKAIDQLKDGDKVLVLEACSHKPLDGDIGRVKIPALLHKKIGPHVTVEVISGDKIPEVLKSYQLIIHCGGCMFNRAHVLSRIEQCKRQGIPITNYGVFFAHMAGILDQISVGV